MNSSDCESWQGEGGYRETRETLLCQLEAARQCEAARLHRKQEEEEKSYRAALGRLGRRGAVVLAEITELRRSVPRTQQQLQHRFQSLKADIVLLARLLDQAGPEAALLEKLSRVAAAARVPPASCPHLVTSRAAVLELSSRLAAAQTRERDQLAAVRLARDIELDTAGTAGEKEVGRVEGKVSLLEAELQLLGEERDRRGRQHRTLLVKLAGELERAARPARAGDQGGLQCPACLASLSPGLAVYQCRAGHILCSGCKPSYDWRHDRLYKDCPECSDKIVILTEFNRD